MLPTKHILKLFIEERVDFDAFVKRCLKKEFL